MIGLKAYAFCSTFFIMYGLSAQAENVVKLHAVQLGSPTSWCAADEGVPFKVTMDGPDVGGILASKFYVIERHGNERVRVEIPAPDGHKDPNSAHIGRFSADFEVCRVFWDSDRIRGEWRVIQDGKTLSSGSHDGYFGYGNIPLFRNSYGTESYSFRLPDNAYLVANGPVVVTKTTEAFASPAQEQSQ